MPSQPNKFKTSFDFKNKVLYLNRFSKHINIIPIVSFISIISYLITIEIFAEKSFRIQVKNQ